MTTSVKQMMEVANAAVPRITPAQAREMMSKGNTLVVETNNMRGAEDGPFDGWLDVNGSPYSEQVKFTERFRRPTFGHLQMDITVDDPKAYTKPWTVTLHQRIALNTELVDEICLENEKSLQRMK